MPPLYIYVLAEVSIAFARFTALYQGHFHIRHFEFWNWFNHHICTYTELYKITELLNNLEFSLELAYLSKPNFIIEVLALDK